MYKIESYGNTDKGTDRKSNEDAFLIDSEHHVYAVADGLGGLPHGDVASKLAIDSIKEEFNKDPINVEEAFNATNALMLKKAQELKEELGIATTLTAIKIEGNKLVGGHIGDSGLLLFHDNKLTQLTKDDTMAEQIRGDNLDNPSVHIPDTYNNILTQCVGGVKKLHPQHISLEIPKDSILLLYTDGVTKTHAIEELLLVSTQHNNPKDFVKKIIDEANKRGGPDNVTAIAIYVS